MSLYSDPITSYTNEQNLFNPSIFADPETFLKPLGCNTSKAKADFMRLLTSNSGLENLQSKTY